MCSLEMHRFCGRKGDRLADRQEGGIGKRGDRKTSGYGGKQGRWKQKVLLERRGERVGVGGECRKVKMQEVGKG